ncbi:MAG: AFG1 family ATPase [Rhodocyclaceae bacterium]|nr:AFG1 family ATPase [Rhodocyclaceae bacterium]MCA3026850.1 AFG1 family ATPase [Rhodocyclaceae bacterium]MCA3029147.1 AFG1 family ATPase [Rhodocyclaceae bacterium]MCA3033137.1 AFG1 family ATPase [Rhodocyclaceae bacterium]MCA3038503.1 AFG1 family ATPase [Rhodocyclaceae bacterium]
MKATAEDLPNISGETGEAADIEAGSPLEWYWKFSQNHDFESDPAQIAVLNHLDRLHGEIENYRQYRQGKINRLVTNFGGGKKPPRGLYIWGRVGRGKSLMMDAFFNVSTLKRKRRVHFHEFMREVHAEMRAHSGEEDPLDAVSNTIAKQLRLLCFDEFHVSDIADAMILGRLLELLTAKGVVLVMTSNYRPDDLYPSGLQRARFLPAIELLKRDLEVLEIGGERDHRRRILESIPVYHTPPDAAAEQALGRAFSAMSKSGFAGGGSLTIGNRPMGFIRRAKGVVWFDFKELCVKPRSQMDYLEIASQYHTVLISNIPQLHAKNSADVVRRFTWLVDVFYDQRVKLICSANATPEWLVVDDRVVGANASLGATTATDASMMVSAEFARTASRLREMQSKEYFSRKHASADNPQVLQTN